MTNWTSLCFIIYLKTDRIKPTTNSHEWLGFSSTTITGYYFQAIIFNLLKLACHSLRKKNVENSVQKFSDSFFHFSGHRSLAPALTRWQDLKTALGIERDECKHRAKLGCQRVTQKEGPEKKRVSLWLQCSVLLNLLTPRFKTQFNNGADLLFFTSGEESGLQCYSSGCCCSEKQGNLTVR